jgi:hypothetical protein
LDEDADRIEFVHDVIVVVVVVVLLLLLLLV